MHIRKRTTCRVCGSSSLKKVIDLGPQYLQGSFVKPGKEMPSTRKIDCTLVRCNPEKDENACGLLQMEHSVPSEILYAAYWYRSGTNNTMRNHLKNIVDDVTSVIKKDKVSVLDIGCNDGTLLSNYPESFEKFMIKANDLETTDPGFFDQINLIKMKKWIEALDEHFENLLKYHLYDDERRNIEHQLRQLRQIAFPELHQDGCDNDQGEPN